MTVHMGVGREEKRKRDMEKVWMFIHGVTIGCPWVMNGIVGDFYFLIYFFIMLKIFSVLFF